jgi:hypothetical protein
MRQVLQFDLANEDVAVEINGVVAIHCQTKVAMVEGDAGGEGVTKVALTDLPARIAGPEQLAALRAGDITVDAEVAWPGAAVVFLPDMRKVDVANLVLMIERDQKRPVTDWYITRHAYPVKI